VNIGDRVNVKILWVDNWVLVWEMI
jgi:hypothetical protein